MTDGYTIRTHLKPGDIGYPTYLHGILYAREQGRDHTFDAYVAGPLSGFVKAGSVGQRTWIVEESGEIRGSIALARIDPDRARLRWFLLDPGLRGKGMGKRLMALLFEFAGEQNCRSIELWTVRGLEEAAGLYRRFGFEVMEERTSQVRVATVIEPRDSDVDAGSPGLGCRHAMTAASARLEVAPRPDSPGVASSCRRDPYIPATLELEPDVKV